MADLLDTPSRVLKRVQQYEEMELPSLPSFQRHDLDLSDDFDVDSSRESVTDRCTTSERDQLITPLVTRRLPSTSDASSARTASTVKPLRSTVTDMATSSPQLRSMSRLDHSTLDISYDYSDTRSDTDAIVDEPATRHTYEDHSSISPRTALSTRDKEVDDTEVYPPSTTTSFISPPAGPLGMSYQTAENTPKHMNEARIPSLSTSEVSSNDVEATTPEGGESLRLPHVHYGSPHLEDKSSDLTADNLTPVPSSLPGILDSPEATPGPIRYMDYPSTAARAAATPFAPLRDVTTRYRNRRPLSPSLDRGGSSRALVDHTAQHKSSPMPVLAFDSLPSRFSPLRRTTAPQSFASSTTAKPDDASNHSDEDRRPLHLGTSVDDHIGDRSVVCDDGSSSGPGANMPSADVSMESPQHIHSMSPFAKVERHLNRMDHQLINTSDLTSSEENWQEERGRLLQVIRDAGLDAETGEYNKDLNADGTGKDVSLSELVSLRAELQDTRDQLQDAHEEMSRVKVDFSRKTEEYYHMFSEIGADYTKQIEALQDEVGQTKGEVTRLQTQLDMLRPSSAVQEDELRKQIAILGGDLSRAQEDAQIVAEALANAQARLSEAHANEQATLEQLQQAEDRADTLQSHLHSAEREVQQITQCADDLRSQLVASEKSLLEFKSRLEFAHREETSEIEDLRARLDAAQNLAEERARELTAMQARLATASRLVEQRDGQILSFEARVSSLTDEKDALREEKCLLSQRVEQLELRQRENQGVMDHERKVIQQLEEVVTTSTTEIETSQKRVAELEMFLSTAQAAQADSQAELQSLQHQLMMLSLERPEADQSRDSAVSTSADMTKSIYQAQLDEAHRHIGRLKAELERMPARHRTLEDRDARIHALTAEKEILLERLKAREMASPARYAHSMAASTPALHRAVSALRSPRTPGPLKDLSWLQTTMDDSQESVLRAELGHLQLDFDAAQAQLDKNFDALEKAGLVAIRLAEELAAARLENGQLKEEQVMQGRVNKQKDESLERGRSQNERLEAALEQVHQRLSSVRDHMTAEKERLQEHNRRLRLQLSDMRLKYEEELERLSEEAARVHEEAQEDIALVNRRNEQLRAEKDILTANLRKSEGLVSRHEAEAARLHTTVKELEEVRDSLRHEQGAAVEAQDKVRSLQATLEKTSSSLKASQESLNQLRNELRICSDELADKDHEVEALTLERQRITRELAQLGNDLAVQRRECASFGSELLLLKTQQRQSAQVYPDQLASLRDSLRAKQADLAQALQQAQDARDQCLVLQERLQRLQSRFQASGAEQRQKYKAQMRRLSAQIEYLQAMYARENSFRDALALQKKFLILCVGGMSLNEQATLRMIASMGYEVAPLPRPKRTLRSVGLAVLSLVRAK
ncbi:hypothetical protein CC85DRAFT_288238 [Cutaneotrichosporon oleaginosum]|uniref:Pericentrin/AKAP-450 centrosomal targeting domain-containing protein n=1 Tax=Cutaneotrichosporon oleaginosum TaxID=879819 RepID=A0A0J1AWS8_9TREE|nr:uncharacterized protein CC85DRAFT_288238 [Cutaneotrichosporon oleaginosum]KLT39749.1 hypothetical protein CC85DRAFT_288238 [Cutaneotrichosporon oleaginosum]TXT12241.1 hypothetical protein COLE_02651 [Cutaneotrichosporon oleaginosum]